MASSPEEAEHSTSHHHKHHHHHARHNDGGTPKSSATTTPVVTLSNGVHVPVVGFGTAFFYDGLRRPETAWTALPAALDAGYRHIDGASMYGCERQVGGVLGRYFMEGKLTREEVFITTKVGHPPVSEFPNARTQYLYDPEISAYDGALQEFYTSLDNLGLGYVDLVLIHWPGLFEGSERFPKGWNAVRPGAELAAKKRCEMWQALEYIYERRLARAIGVSNFTMCHVVDVLKHCKVKPMMNQVECHPYLQQTELVGFCQRHGITLTAYAPLGSGSNNVLADEQIVRLASKKGVAPSQLVLSWLVQRGIAVIPKSTNPERQALNLHVSTTLLTPEELEVMASLDRGLRVFDDPAKIP